MGGFSRDVTGELSQLSKLAHIVDNGGDNDHHRQFMMSRATFDMVCVEFGRECSARLIRKSESRGIRQSKPKLKNRRHGVRMSLAIILTHLVKRPDLSQVQLLSAGCHATSGRHIQCGMKCLHLALRRIPNARVELPTPGYMRTLADAVEFNAPDNADVRGVWGFLDGSMHPMWRPKDPAEQRRWYNGYYGCHGYKGLYLFLADGTVGWAVLGEGAYHDNNLYTELDLWLHRNCPPDLRVMGDSAFTRSRHMIRPFTEQELGAIRSAADLARASAYNRRISRVRIAAEWGVKDVKRFSVFDSKFPTDPATAKLTWACAVMLHNLVARVEDISQTRNAFFSVHAKARQHILRV